MIFEDISSAVGKTPLVELKNTVSSRIRLLAKLEWASPTGSVKGRSAYAMLEDAEKSGILKGGMGVIEASTGNTGISVASAALSRGYKCTIVLPESSNPRKRKLIEGYGAEIILTSAGNGIKGAIKHAEKILKEKQGALYMPNQFINYANTAIHAITTGPEIDLDAGGSVDVIVAGVGTGGTLSGIGHYFKNIKKADTVTVAVEPTSSQSLKAALEGGRADNSPHRIEGIGAGFISRNMDLSLIDHVVAVDDDEAYFYARHASLKEGIPAGISSGAALCGAIKAIEAFAWQNKTIAVIFPDAIERYI